MTETEISSLSVLSLAHIGDGVYELLVRTHLVSSGISRVDRLHKESVAIVNASAQAKAAYAIMDKLSEHELAVYKRGRNARVNSVPKNTNPACYHAATGLETLFGWLWLREETDRVKQLFTIILETL